MIRMIAETMNPSSMDTTMVLPENSRFVGAVSTEAMGIKLVFLGRTENYPQARKFVRAAPGTDLPADAELWIPLGVVGQYGYTVGIFEIPGHHIIPETMRRNTQQGSIVDTIRDRWNA